MLHFRKTLAVSGALSALVLGDPIPVPNFSFESPPVVRDEKNPFGALPFLDDWDETAIGLTDEFDQNTGVFLNTDPPSPDRITNAHLERLAFISSLIGNDLRQELVQKFEPGRSYTLTVGVAHSLNFPVGATEGLEVALFYFDGGSEQVIASSTVTGSGASNTALTDVVVNLSEVSMTDPWADKPIGILIRPAVNDPDDGDGEGFWDADNVRLDATGIHIPTVSFWGLAIVCLSLLCAGTILVGRNAVGPVANASRH